jgi:hypothetical protein
MRSLQGLGVGDSLDCAVAFAGIDNTMPKRRGIFGDLLMTWVGTWRERRWRLLLESWEWEYRCYAC